MANIPIDEIAAYVENYLSITDRARNNDVERSEAFKTFAAARENAGLETNENDFTSLCAADLRTLAQDFASTKNSLDYSSTGSKTLAVGAYDPITGKWI